MSIHTLFEPREPERNEAVKVVVKRKRIHVETPPEPTLQAAVARESRIFRLEHTADASVDGPIPGQPEATQQQFEGGAIPGQPHKLRRRSRNADKRPVLIRHVIISDGAAPELPGVDAATATSPELRAVLEQMAQLDETLDLIRFGQSFNLAVPGSEQRWAELAKTAEQIEEQLKALSETTLDLGF